MTNMSAVFPKPSSPRRPRHGLKSLSYPLNRARPPLGHRQKFTAACPRWSRQAEEGPRPQPDMCSPHRRRRPLVPPGGTGHGTSKQRNEVSSSGCTCIVYRADQKRKNDYKWLQVTASDLDALRIWMTHTPILHHTRPYAPCSIRTREYSRKSIREVHTCYILC